MFKLNFSRFQDQIKETVLYGSINVKYTNTYNFRIRIICAIRDVLKTSLVLENVNICNF